LHVEREIIENVAQLHHVTSEEIERRNPSAASDRCRSTGFVVVQGVGHDFLKDRRRDRAAENRRFGTLYHHDHRQYRVIRGGESDETGVVIPTRSLSLPGYGIVAVPVFRPRCSRDDGVGAGTESTTCSSIFTHRGRHARLIATRFRLVAVALTAPFAKHVTRYQFRFDEDATVRDAL